MLRKTEVVFREYFLSSNSFKFTKAVCLPSRKLTILLLRKVAPYFMTPSLSFHPSCSELVVEGLAGVVFAEDRFQVGVNNARFLKANGHCFCALLTEVGYKLLCSNPLVTFILPLSYHLGVVAHSQLKKKGASSLHQWKIFFTSPLHLPTPSELPKGKAYTQLMLKNIDDSLGKHFLNKFCSPNSFCS